MVEIDWKDAELFDAEGVERLRFEEPHAALERLTDDMVPHPMEEDEFVAWLRREEVQVTVVGYQRASLNHPQIHTAAFNASEEVRERLHEEGVLDPEEWTRSDDLGRALERAFLATIVRLVREDGGPWHCEEVARHTYDAEEIIAELGLEQRAPQKGDRL